MNYSKSVYTLRPDDCEAVFLGSEEYPVYGDGVSDDTKNIQKALNELKRKDNYGIIYVPEGTYLVSDTLYVPRAIRLIGIGEKRPVIKLMDHAPGYDTAHPEDKTGGKSVIWFVHGPVDTPEDIRDANPGTFYSALTNIDIEIGEGNPYAAALRTHYAQHCFVSHCVVNIRSGLVGMYDCGNEMEDVHFIGGDYGIITTKCSPGWPFMAVDCSFEDQRKAGMYSQELGLTAVRFSFKNMPKAIDTFEGYHDKIYLEDSSFENISEAALTIHLEKNAFTQWNLCNVICKDVPVIADFADKGEKINAESDIYRIDRFTYGVILEKADDPGEIKCELIAKPEAAFDTCFEKDIPELPPMEEWVNVRALGAKGDNEADDTEAIRKAISEHKVLYFPQGQYLVSDTLKLKDDTVLIGLNPISTQIRILDNNENFGDLGPAKPLIESGRGANIINGIGIDTGARNPRAVGLKWIANEKSYVNDVKFLGGHGGMTHNMNDWGMPYNASRTGDVDPARKWDTEYWSFWVTDNGGGVFKDVWSASPYCAAGFYADNTSTRGRIYCMSVEHHVRNEVKFRNVSNWKIYALQTEEETAESQQCLPLEVIDCKDISFLTYYSFRVIWLPNPYPTAIRVSGNDNVEWVNFHNFTQVKYTLTNGMIDTNKKIEVRPWQIARYVEKNDTEYNMPALTETPVQLYEGFEFADGSTVDAEGNFYFADSRWNRIYKSDAVTGELTLIRDVPQKPLSLFFDKKGNLLVVCEFEYPRGATKNGELMTFTKPADSKGTAYGIFYFPFCVVKVYCIDPKDPENTMTVLEAQDLKSVPKVTQALHPANRWREDNSFLTMSIMEPEKAYVAPDGETIIPVFYDLIRSNAVYAARPGEKFYLVDEYYKRTVSFDVKENGLLENPEVFLEHGEYSIAVDKDNKRMFVAEADILVFDMETREMIKRIPLAKRPTTLTIGGKNKDILFITAVGSVFAAKI